MSKTKFAKIFELPEHQVLVQSIYEDGDGDTPYKINQVTEIEEAVRAEINLCYETETARDNNFKRYDKVMALAFVSSIIQLLKPDENE